MVIVDTSVWIDYLNNKATRHFLLHNDRDFDAFEQFLDLQVIHP